LGWICVPRDIPKFARWIATHRLQADVIFSIICILWGGGVWYLIITKNAYSNTLAVVIASLLVCVGIYSLAKRFMKKA
jgi:hypothetical protein